MIDIAIFIVSMVCFLLGLLTGIYICSGTIHSLEEVIEIKDRQLKIFTKPQNKIYM